MSVKAVAKSTNPDSISVSIEMEMTLGEWRDLLGKINKSGHPAWRVADAIEAAISAFTERHLGVVEYTS